MTVMPPADALLALRAAAADGALGDLCRRCGTSLLVAFGSAVSGPVPAGARDLDVAVLGTDGSSTLAVLTELSDLTRFDAIDLLDLGTQRREVRGRLGGVGHGGAGL